MNLEVIQKRDLIAVEKELEDAMKSRTAVEAFMKENRHPDDEAVLEKANKKISALLNEFDALKKLQNINNSQS